MHRIPPKNNHHSGGDGAIKKRTYERLTFFSLLFCWVLWRRSRRLWYKMANENYWAQHDLDRDVTTTTTAKTPHDPSLLGCWSNQAPLLYMGALVNPCLSADFIWNTRAGQHLRRPARWTDNGPGRTEPQNRQRTIDCDHKIKIYIRSLSIRRAFLKSLPNCPTMMPLCGPRSTVVFLRVFALSSPPAENTQINNKMLPDRDTIILWTVGQVWPY